MWNFTHSPELRIPNLKAYHFVHFPTKQMLAASKESMGASFFSFFRDGVNKMKILFLTSKARQGFGCPQLNKAYLPVDFSLCWTLSLENYTLGLVSPITTTNNSRDSRQDRMGCGLRSCQATLKIYLDPGNRSHST